MTDLLAAAGQLHCDELLLIVLLECRLEARNEFGVGHGEGLDVFVGLAVGRAANRRRRVVTCDDICELQSGQLGVCTVETARRTSPGGAPSTKEDTVSTWDILG